MMIGNATHDEKGFCLIMQIQMQELVCCGRSVPGD